jgi:hypothetical protein
VTDSSLEGPFAPLISARHPLMLIYVLIVGVPIQSVSLFLPQIVQRIVTDKVKVNLYTVAPNITVRQPHETISPVQ